MQRASLKKLESNAFLVFKILPILIISSIICKKAIITFEDAYILLADSKLYAGLQNLETLHWSDSLEYLLEEFDSLEEISQSEMALSKLGELIERSLRLYSSIDAPAETKALFQSLDNEEH